MTYDGPVEAPIKKDQIVAKLKVIYNESLIDEYDLLYIHYLTKYSRKCPF